MGVAEHLAQWGSRLELDDVPGRVVSFARSQLVSQLAAARAALSHPLGERLVRAFGDPLQDDPRRAAYALAALTVCLDFDDTAYAGHVSHSAVNVPLAYAGALGLDGRALLTASIAANECAARVTAAATLGPFRGQTAAHAHLAGSVAGRMRAEGAPAQTWTDALGIAFAMPPWSLERAFLASDAKALVASVPIAMGLDACDAAAAGLGGAPDVLEHPGGFLARFADVPLPEAATRGLGEAWHTETLSFKLFPVSAYISSAIDCAAELHERLAGVDAGEIEEVVLLGSLLTVALAARVEPGAPPPSATTLSFSAPYAVAVALLTGGFDAHDLAEPRVAERVRWELAERVRVEHDTDQTRRAVAGTAPLGQALRQAGERAGAWARAQGGDEGERLVTGLGDPEPDFTGASKTIGARLRVRLRDGTELEAARERALGAAGPETAAAHPELVRRKFLATGGSPAAAGALARVDELGPAELLKTIRLALRGEAPGPAYAGSASTGQADATSSSVTRSPTS